MALSWLGRRIELNRAAVIVASLALGLMLGGLVLVWKHEEAHDDAARHHIAELAHNNRDAIRRIGALEQPTFGNLKALIVRFLRRELRRRARGAPLRPTVPGRRPSTGTSPPSTPPAPRTSPREPAGGTGTPSAPGQPPTSPAQPGPLAPLEDLLDRLPLP